MRLNDAGRAFLACAQDILQRADAALQTARRAARGEVGELTLGFTESASFNAVVTELIRQYRQRYPDVEMTLTQGDSETLVAQLRGARSTRPSCGRPSRWTAAWPSPTWTKSR